MRRQMQLRPSQGGKFRGPVGTPMPEENPAKTALARLRWPLPLSEVFSVGLLGLVEQAEVDGFIKAVPACRVWELTEKGAALLGVRPPGFREDFADAGRAMVDAIRRVGLTGCVSVW